MNVDTVTYYFCLEGTVDKYQLSWGGVLWEGPLYGTKSINEVEYAVIASFSRMDNRQDAQISVSVQSITDGDLFAPVCFSFGSLLVSPDIVEDLGGDSHEASTTSVDVAGDVLVNLPEAELTAVDSRYTLIPYSTQISLYNQMTGLEDVNSAAHIGRAYYYKDAAKILISVTTNADKLYDYYVNTLPLGSSPRYTMLRNVRIELSWVEYAFSNNLIYIAEMDSIDESAFSGSDATYVVIKTLMEDALVIMGIDGPTINAIFGAAIDEYLKGDVCAECNTDRAFVDIKLGGYNYRNFDLADPGIAVVFQIDTANSGAAVNGVYKYRNSVVYQTLVYSYNDSTIPYAFFYYNTTPDTSFTFNITMP